MDAKVKEAVDYLVSTYSSVTEAARSWTLNPTDVQAALKDATPDTAEYYVLTLLAQANPVSITATTKDKKSTAAVNADSAA